MRTELIVIAVLFFVVAVSGCTQTNIVNDAKQACISLCQQANTDLSNGPCLSEISSWSIDDYVCDVAHNPRQSVDDLSENQCAAFGETADHFVEVAPDCSFIREV